MNHAFLQSGLAIGMLVAGLLVGHVTAASAGNAPPGDRLTIAVDATRLASEQGWFITRGWEDPNSDKRLTMGAQVYTGVHGANAVEVGCLFHNSGRVLVLLRESGREETHLQPSASAALMDWCGSLETKARKWMADARLPYLEESELVFFYE